MKYIDAEKLKAEIERRMGKHWEGLPDADSPEDDWTHNELCELGAYKELEHIEDFLNSLQQEQPEVDLGKEIDAMWNPHFNLGWDEYSCLTMNRGGFEKLVRHFYELGLKARKK